MIDRYSRPEMTAIWTLENRYRNWFKVEQAVCQAWNEQGVIPDEDLKNIMVDMDFDIDRILEIEQTTRHDVIAFLTYLEEKIGPSARFIHLGCTSSDMVDTGMALQMVQAGEIILKDFDMVLDTLASFVREHKGLVCMGRSHGIHGEPITYGFKFAGFYAEFLRDKKRFAAAVEDIRTGKLSGAMGNYTVITPAVEARACELMGLKADIISTQIVQRDRYAHYFTALAIAAGTVERICVELRHLQRTEVHEVEEGFGKGQKGSSAMPHKRNPVGSAVLIGAATRVPGLLSILFSAMPQEHERSLGLWHAEWETLPEICCVVSGALVQALNIARGLEVDSERMARNLDLTHGLVLAEAVSIVLTQRVGREIISCRIPRVVIGVLGEEPQITAHLSAQELDRLLDPAHYLGQATTWVERARAEHFALVL